MPGEIISGTIVDLSQAGCARKPHWEAGEEAAEKPCFGQEESH
jgi:hypothetical protein